MGDDTKIKSTDAEETLTFWEKTRLFIKKNKSKIVGIFAAIVAYLAGDGTISSLLQAIWTTIFGV